MARDQKKELKRQIFTGRILALGIEEHLLPDGRRADFEIVRHPGGAAALPLLADGRVVLVRQFRPAAGGMVWEIPAGRLEGDESAEACLARELEEEVGYRARRLIRLGELATAIGFCDEIVYLYLAEDLVTVARQPEPDEYIEVVPMPGNRALELLDRGEIKDGKTQLALLLAHRIGRI